MRATSFFEIILSFSIQDIDVYLDNFIRFLKKVCCFFWGGACFLFFLSFFQFLKERAPIYSIVEKGKILYFGLARNLIRHLISPNQDDLSYSTRTFHFRLTDGLSCKTHSLWLENADQCRRHTGRSSIAMLLSWTIPVQISYCGSSIAAATWTHEGIHLIYGFLTSNPSWTWIRYIQQASHRHNFMSPQNWQGRSDA